jgi:hypothetical protein
LKDLKFDRNDRSRPSVNIVLPFFVFPLESTASRRNGGFKRDMNFLFRRTEMRRTIQMVTLAVALGLPFAALAQGMDMEEITARCEAEAKDNGITDPDELAEYVKQCVADLSASQPGD